MQLLFSNCFDQVIASAQSDTPQQYQQLSQLSKEKNIYLYQETPEIIEWRNSKQNPISSFPIASSNFNFIPNHYATKQKKTYKSNTSNVLCAPEPSKKAKRSAPVDLITRRISALYNKSGTAAGRKNSNTIENAGALDAISPKLLAASPIKVLTNAPLNAPPILVFFSDLKSRKTIKYLTHSPLLYSAKKP